MQKHTSNTHLDVSGKMTAHDAGHVGKILAVAGLIFATCTGLAVLVYAIRWW